MAGGLNSHRPHQSKRTFERGGEGGLAEETLFKSADQSSADGSVGDSVTDYEVKQKQKAD